MNDGIEAVNDSLTPDMQKAYAQFKALRATRPLAEWKPEWITGLKVLAFKLAARQEVPFYPPIVYIEPTNACNCRCIICPRRTMTRPTGYMAMDLFERIIDDIAGQGPSDIRLFNFGEPLLHPRLADMIRHCHARGLSARFQTNGLLLTQERIEALLDAGMDYIGVSVNGLNADEYAQIRPGQDYGALKATLSRMRTIASGRKADLHIHLNAQMLREEAAERKDEVQAFVRSWDGIADSMSVSGLSLYDHVAFMQGGAVTEASLADIPRKADGEVTCTEPFDRLVIKWDGRVTPCCVDFDADLVVGDAARQTIEEIWQSRALTNLRAIIRNKAYSKIPRCRSCPLFYSERFSVVFKK